MSESKLDINNGRAVYARLLSYVRPYLGAFIVAIVGMTLVAGTEVGFSALMKPMLDGTFVDKDPFYITFIPLAIVGVFLVRGIGSFIVSYYMGGLGRNVVRDLRREMFDRILTLPSRFYDKQSSGQLISKMIFDVEQVATASSTAITILIQDTLTVIGLLAYMSWLNWKLTLIILLAAPIIGVIVNYVNKRLRVVSQRLQGSVGDVTSIAQESIDAQQVVKIFGGKEYETKGFSAVNENNRRQHMKIIVTSNASVSLMQLLAASLLATIVYLATQPEWQQEVSVGSFMSLIIAMMLMLPAIKRLTTINANLQRGIAAAQSVFSFLAENAEPDTGKASLRLAQGSVCFQDVSFTYDQHKGQVLNSISFDVKAGETIALVGRSGSGKTTVMSLLPRFYELTAGSITVDGHDIRDLKLADLRRQIAMVSQNVTLFNDTIAHNIAYGRLDTADEAAIVAAARSAHVMEFVQKLPDGLNTLVGDKGVMLSGGQRQRLAIARAILKDAPILILDEATSALDTESERLIQAALDELMKHRTTFVIAHRLSTIENADKIIVMNQGEIVEMGSHSELLSENSHYATLYRMQFGNE